MILAPVKTVKVHPIQSSQVPARGQRGVEWWECEMPQGQEVGHSQSALVGPWVSRGPGMLTCNGGLEGYPPKASAFLGLPLAAWLGPSCFSATGSTVQLLFLLLFDLTATTAAAKAFREERV